MTDNKPNPYDWPEDDMKYSHVCACGNDFSAKKQRHVCKACTMDDMTEKIVELTRLVKCKDSEMSELIYKHNSVVEYLEGKIK